jgi:hypothetical protein
MGTCTLHTLAVHSALESRDGALKISAKEALLSDV